MQTTYAHKEAFCLMYYESKAKNGFMVWNSRDGVTPFTVFEDGVEYNHTHWFLDRRLVPEIPQHMDYLNRHILLPGHRIFRDTTPEEAREYAIKRLASAKGTAYEVEEGSEKYSQLLESLTKDFTGEPDMVKVVEPGVMP